jgi:hypothetical protein
LYNSEDELSYKLRRLLREYRQMNETRAEIAQSTAQFDWKNRIAEFDALFEELVKSKK